VEYSAAVKAQAGRDLCPQCHFDGNAAFNNPGATSNVSTIDYFHPSIAGQAKLAAVAWNASGFV
jgi:hypothetical protein